MSKGARGSQREADGLVFTDESISAPPVRSVRVHPLVIFSIADLYKRSSVNVKMSAMGALFGETVDDSAVVLDCVPFLEDPTGKNLFRPNVYAQAAERHQAMYQKEVPLGFFSFSDDRIDWKDHLPENGEARIYLWMRPSSPPKWDVVSIQRAQGEVVSLPIEFAIEASAEEQLGLSRLSSGTCSGSLQSAVSELGGFMDSMCTLCNRTDEAVLAKDRLTGRSIYVAEHRAKVKESAKKALQNSMAAIESFKDALSKSDALVKQAEATLSLPL